MADEEATTEVETEEIKLPAENQASEGVGGGGVDEETQLTILTGEKMEWFFDSSSGKWYVSYGLPDSDRSVLFEASPAQMDALFGKNQRPVGFTRRTLERLTGSSLVTFAGNIAEMEGEGKFEDEVRRIKALALDNGVLPSWAEETNEIMDLVFIAQSEGKSDEWLLDQISGTEAFKVRFPGFDKFKSQGNLTTEEAITGFLEFEAQVKSAVKGIGMGPNRVTPDIVGGLLNKGYNINTVVDSLAKFERLKEYRPAMAAFNRVLVANDKDPISSLQDMFDFISGTAPADIYDVWEASSVSEAAAAAGLGDVFTAEDAMRVAVATEGQTSLADANAMFTEAAQLLLRLRNEVTLDRYGLNQEDIIDMSLGVPPSSGTSAAEISENINRAIASAKGSLDKNVNPFIDFDESGRAGAASLGGLR